MTIDHLWLVCWRGAGGRWVVGVWITTWWIAIALVLLVATLIWLLVAVSIASLWDIGGWLVLILLLLLLTLRVGWSDLGQLCASSFAAVTSEQQDDNQDHHSDCNSLE